MVYGKIGRILFFRLSENEDLIDFIKKKAEENDVRAGILILIGALKSATIGFYKAGTYKQVQLEEPLEIASCMGNIAIGKDDEIMVHAHIVVSNEEGKSFGGHLMKNSRVSVTAELMIIEGTNLDLFRAFDEKTKLNLLKLD